MVRSTAQLPMGHRAGRHLRRDKYRHSTKVAAMDAHDEHDDHTNDGDPVMAQRARGTTADPPDEQWSRVSEIVLAIVCQSAGLTHTRCRAVACASTDSVGDHQPHKSSVLPTEPSGCCSIPSPSPALQHTGADR